MIITPASLPEAWHGIAEWTSSAGLWQPWRIPRAELETCHTDDLTARAMIPNGARLTLSTDATTVSFTTTGDPERESRVDVVVDGSPHSTHPVPEPRTATEVTLGPGPKSVELWLPHSARTRISPVDLPDATFADPLPPPSTRWVAYGSSITQCNGAPSPTRTWPALVSRELSWHLTSLGLAGQCHLDHAVARTIAATAADLVFLCLGINVHNHATFTARSLPSAVTGFVRTVRVGHPTAPVVVMSPIASPTREYTKNTAALTLSDVREIVTDTTTTLIDQGDENLHLVDGRTILSADEEHLLPDTLHPSADGYEHMAARLAPELRKHAER